MLNSARTLALSFLGSVAILPLLVLPVMVGSLVDYLGMTESLAGWAAAAGFLGGALAAVVISLRIHHLDLRKLALYGLLVMLTCDAACIAAPSLPTWLFFALRFLSGIGAAGAYASVMSAFARTRQPDRAYGLFMAMQFAGSAIGLYGLPFLLPLAGIEGLYISFVVAEIVAVSLVSSLPDREERQAQVVPDIIEWRILLTRTALVCLLGIFLFEAANMAHFTYAERIGLTAGLNNGQIGAVLGIATFLGIPAALAVVWFGERWGHFVPVLIGTSCQILALVVLVFAPSAVVYILAMCMLASAWAFSLPYIHAIEAEIDPGGSVVVAGGFATSLGGFIGPAGAAMLIHPGAYSTMLISAAVALLFVIGLMRYVCARVRSGPQFLSSTTNGRSPLPSE